LIFVDTGAYIGKFVEHDQHHVAATKAWERVNAERPPLVTSNFVIDEAATNLARIAGYEFAAAITVGLLTDRRLTILRPDQEDEIAATKLFKKYASDRVSFTDCISFVLMRRAKMTTAFAFDRHFRSAGFELFPPAD